VDWRIDRRRCCPVPRVVFRLNRPPEEAHQITDFCVEVKVAKFNELKIVPMITFNEGVVPGLKKIHSL